MSLGSMLHFIESVILIICGIVRHNVNDLGWLYFDWFLKLLCFNCWFNFRYRPITDYKSTGFC